MQVAICVATIATHYWATARYYLSSLHLVSSNYPGYPGREPTPQVPSGNKTIGWAVAMH